jgi:acyl carrier protein
MSEINKKIKNVMSTVFDVDISSISENASPDDIESWDSLRHLNLAVALEEAFQIEFSEEDIMELMNLKLIELKIKEKTNG